jgi:hypothetical protein
MIRPLRRAHRTVFLLLAILLPLVLILALTRRPDPPVQREWPFSRPHAQVAQQP